MVPDQTMSTNNNTHRDDDDTNDAMEDVVATAVVVTGTNKKRKPNHQSQDHLKRKKSKNSIQANTEDGIYGDNYDDDNYNDNDDEPESENDDKDDGSEWNDDNSDNNSGVVTAGTTMTMTNGEKVAPIKNKEKWNEMFARLMKYKTKYQSTSVLRTFEDGRLAFWVHFQRQMYNKKNVDEERIIRLNSIGFVWNQQDAKWTEMYERLVAYREQYGSTCVPGRYEIDPQLGLWVDNQRKSTRKLSVDRRNLLNSIGFDWSARDAKWTKMYERLVAYKDQYGSTCISKSYKADPKLATWVHAQRASYNKNSSHLTAEKKQQLNSIGFVWKVRNSYNMSTS